MFRSRVTPCLLFCGLLVLGIAEAPTEGNRTVPTLCHYEEDGVTKPCELFRKVECQNIAYEPEHYDAYVLEEGEVHGQLYNNVTLFALSHGEGFLGINGTDECWQFKVGSTPHPEKYMIMDLNFFPDIFSENIQMYRDGGRCGYLHNSSYSLQEYTSESGKLAFSFRPVSGVREVEINLISGDCEINCDGSSSNCNMPLDSYTMKDFSKPLYFADLKHRYYCIRVVHGACVVHTVTMRNKDPLPPPTPSPEEGSVHLVVILSTIGTVVIVLLAAVFVKKRYCEDPFQPQPVATKDPELPTPWPSSLVPQKVLLLYSRDCPQFCAVARALGQLLQAFGNLKVLDPMEQNEIEQVSENISGWLTQHLQSRDVKLVIVVSEGAMVRQNALLNNQLVHIDEPHFLDPVFTLALQQMHDSPQLGNDYKRIFPARFEDFTPSDVSLSLIVPLKCYVLQRHLGKLIAELGDCNATLGTAYEDIRCICPKEVSQLESAIRNMKSYCDNNPHYVKNNFSLAVHQLK